MEDDDGSWKSYREKEKQRENIKGRGGGGREIGEYRFGNIFQVEEIDFSLARVSTGGEWIFITSLSSIGYTVKIFTKRANYRSSKFQISFVS